MITSQNVMGLILISQNSAYWFVNFLLIGISVIAISMSTWLIIKDTANILSLVFTIISPLLLIIYFGLFFPYITLVMLSIITYTLWKSKHIRAVIWVTPYNLAFMYPISIFFSKTTEICNLIKKLSKSELHLIR